MTRRTHILLALALVVASSVLVGPAAAQLLCRGKVATMVGTDRDDVLQGTSANDVIVGGGGRDTLIGLSGRDRLCGGGGADKLFGGEAGDLLAGGSGRDRIVGAGGSDDLFGGTQHDELFGGDGRHDRDYLFGGAGPDYLGGGDGRFDADHLYGGAGDDLVDGGDGASSEDLLNGGSGNDLIDGGEGGRDRASFIFSDAGITADLSGRTAAGDGTDQLVGIEQIEGSALSDVLTGDSGANALFGLGGDDRLVATGGGDELAGGAGDDVLDGGDGSDRATFLYSATAVDADLTRDTATGEGADSLLSIEHLTGSSFDDTLRGDAAANSIDGAWGDRDQLFGEAGDDELNGGLLPGGSLDGGAGSDLCMNGTPTECEAAGHGDPAAHSIVTDPSYGEVLRRNQLRRIRGFARGGLGPAVTGVQLSLRRFTLGGCKWWSGVQQRLIARSCAHRLWFRAPFSLRDQTWEYTLLSDLPVGSYSLRSRAVGAGYKENYFEVGRNLIAFEVTGS